MIILDVQRRRSIDSMGYGVEYRFMSVDGPHGTVTEEKSVQNRDRNSDAMCFETCGRISSSTNIRLEHARAK